MTLRTDRNEQTHPILEIVSDLVAQQEADHVERCLGVQTAAGHAEADLALVVRGQQREADRELRAAAGRWGAGRGGQGRRRNMGGFQCNAGGFRCFSFAMGEIQPRNCGATLLWTCPVGSRRCRPLAGHESRQFVDECRHHRVLRSQVLLELHGLVQNRLSVIVGVARAFVSRVAGHLLADDDDRQQDQLQKRLRDPVWTPAWRFRR